VQTFRGTVSSKWERSEDSFTLEVNVPVNSHAEVSLPLQGWAQAAVTEGGKTVWDKGAFTAGIAGVRGAQKDGDYIRLTVGSGSYKFNMKKTP
jgi:alpha-L-rhamnosidase